MLVNEFKNSLSYKLLGDTNPPEKLSDLEQVLIEGITYLSNRTIPIDLLSTNLNTYTPYRFINQDVFIRKPNSMVELTDKVDIDEQLVYALLFYCVATLTKDVNKNVGYLRRVDSEIDMYEYNNETFLSNL